MPSFFAKARTKLEAYIRRDIDLHTPDTDGATKHDHLTMGREMYRKQGRTEQQLDEMFAELKPVELEKGTEYLVMVFGALSASRGYGMSGPLAITYLEMQAYRDLMNTTLTAWEVETLKAMDKVFLEETYKKQEKG